ncbi:MAG TPA: hypothetical protein VK892_08455 [Pyrinomonadaceae bacterium]|nr:hypothetical protein [Pyrinomonadaceae bacterium]
MSKPGYEKNVFINCPFDKEYQSLFEAIIFTVHDCGFTARCAREISDSSQVRIDKIYQIISDCKYGIHDISRTELDEINQLPRFNMPLELGLFLGAKQFGGSKQKQKLCLVLDKEPFRYQKFCSDIAGQDISSHGNEVHKLIRLVRDWLNDSITDVRIPSGSKIAERYHLFENDLPLYCEVFRKDKTELTFIDFRNLVIAWLENNT